MTRAGCIACVALAMAAAGCDDNPTSPSNPNSPVVVMTAQLNPANEVPPVTNADASARGDVRITFDVVRDGSNNITGGTASFVLNLTGFPAGSTLTGAHIHPGAAGTNGGVIVNTGLSGANAPLVNGAASNLSFNSIAVTAANMQAIINNPAGHYFNVHTTLNPGGAVRGQLTRQ